jgi:hypothetical protein
MSSDRIILKIKKLLALAKSSNPYEAASALSKAQKLMAEHSVDQSAVDLTDCETRKYALDKKTINNYEGHLMNVISTAFGVVPVISEMWKQSKVVAVVNFMGIAPQPELASYCFDVVYRQLIRNRTVFIGTLSKNCKRATKMRRGDDYAKGWMWEVASKVNAFALTEKQTALVEQYKDSVYNPENLKSSKGRDRSKGKARSNDILTGMNDAKAVRLDRPVNGTETLKLAEAAL